jgi:hypothetical protein
LRVLVDAEPSTSSERSCAVAVVATLPLRERAAPPISVRWSAAPAERSGLLTLASALAPMLMLERRRRRREGAALDSVDVVLDVRERGVEK